MTTTPTIVTRGSKGSELTWGEMDANLAAIAAAFERIVILEQQVAALGGTTPTPAPVDGMIDFSVPGQPLS